MTKRVLDVGNCGPDHFAIRRLIEGRFAAEVLQADDWNQTLTQLQSGPIDLVLVNRKLDIDYSDGLEIVRRIKADTAWQHLPVMLISNYPDQQEIAVQAGAVPGFGKSSLGANETLQRLTQLLG
jgi:two-component system chemotaxis response regulator CheY